MLLQVKTFTLLGLHLFICKNGGVIARLGGGVNIMFRVPSCILSVHFVFSSKVGMSILAHLLKRKLRPKKRGCGVLWGPLDSGVACLILHGGPGPVRNRLKID